MRDERPILGYESPKDRQPRYSRSDIVGWAVAILIMLFILALVIDL